MARFVGCSINKKEAGEVTAVGEGVTALEPGTHVIGVGIKGGAFAEYMVLPAAAALPVPAGWADSTTARR
jgi:NADPH2:quinone reductase